MRKNNTFVQKSPRLAGAFFVFGNDLTPHERYQVEKDPGTLTNPVDRRGAPFAQGTAATISETSVMAVSGTGRR